VEVVRLLYAPKRNVAASQITRVPSCWMGHSQ
jgi:hypothetical protein